MLLKHSFRTAIETRAARSMVVFKSPSTHDNLTVDAPDTIPYIISLHPSEWRRYAPCSANPLHSFQILSDLHLEVAKRYSSFEILPSAPYLVLAGNIGLLTDYDSYLAFLARQTQAIKKVFLVLGNHDFYGLSFTAGPEQAQRLEIEPILNGKLVLLRRKRFDIPDSSISIL